MCNATNATTQTQTQQSTTTNVRTRSGNKNNNGGNSKFEGKERKGEDSSSPGKNVKQARTGSDCGGPEKK